MIVLKVTEQEFAHVLAGLRMLQRDAGGETGLNADEVLDEYIPAGQGLLTDEQIDALCERLN